MASSSGMTALLIIGVGVGGYALYRWSKRGEHGLLGHAGQHHAGWYPDQFFIGRGGGGGGGHFHPQQQPDMSQQGGGDGGEFGQPPMPYQQPPQHHFHPHGRRR
jgi:hypothetical protein